jgi:hypothetical protein
MATPPPAPPPSPAISKALQDVLIEVKNAARTMGQASEKLSNVGVDKLTEELKKSLKTRQLLNDAEADAIDDAKKMAGALDALEKQYDAIRKIEEAAEKQKKKALKSAGAAGKTPANIAKADAAEKAYIKSKLEEIDLTEAQAANLKQQIPLIRQETEARAKSIAATDGLRKMHDGLTKSIGDQIKGFASFGTAAMLLKKAFFNSYEQMNRLTNKGMLGTFQTLQLMAPKLLISAQDLEEILSKNRDLINQFGGGIQGVEAFGQEVQNVRSELKYLGQGATKAAAQFIQLSKKSGLTPKDGVAYRKNLNQSIESFKQFSAMFGDTPEQYASLMEAMQDDENIRQRLNNLSKSQLAIELEEQRQRTYNLKLMGLSNEQIVDFNKKMAQLVDPRKSGTIGERAKQALMLKQTTAVLISQLSKGNPQQQAMAEQLKNNQGGMNAISNAMATGSPEQIRKAMADNPEFARAFAQAMAETDQNDIRSNEVRNKTFEGMGPLGQLLAQMGGALSTAQAQGADIKGQNTPDQLKQLEQKNRQELLADQSATAAALVAMTTAIEGVKTILEQPLTQALLGAVAGLWAFTGALGMKGILGALGSLGSGIKGVASLLIGNGGLMGILGRLGAVGAAGAAGYAVGEYVVNPLLNKGAEAITGQKGATVGSALYDGVGKLQSMGFLPGQSDAQKQQQSEQRAWQSSYQSKISTQGFITKKQADMYRSNGVQVDNSKIKEEGASSSSSMPYDFNAFARDLGQRESGGNYGIVNTIGYAGKYQFGAQALETVGLMKPGSSKGGNKAMNDPSNWTIPGGLQAFLSNAQIQEDAFKRLTDMNYRSLLKAGVITPNTPSNEIAGYLATAHLKGVGGAIDLKKGIVSKDGYGTTTSSYFALGSKSQGGSGAMTVAAAQPMATPTGVSAPGPAGQTVAAAAAAKPAATSGGGTTTVASAGSQQDPQMAELKAQTALLAAIAQNTANRMSTSTNPNAYKQDTALVMGGTAG